LKLFIASIVDEHPPVQLPEPLIWSSAVVKLAGELKPSEIKIPAQRNLLA
jgi:hypothetical protein